MIKCSSGWKPCVKTLALSNQDRAGAQLCFVLGLWSWYNSCWQLQVVAYSEYILQLSGNNIAPTKSQCCVIWVIQVGRCQTKLKMNGETVFHFHNKSSKLKIHDDCIESLFLWFRNYLSSVSSWNQTFSFEIYQLRSYASDIFSSWLDFTLVAYNVTLVLWASVISVMSHFRLSLSYVACCKVVHDKGADYSDTVILYRARRHLLLSVYLNCERGAIVSVSAAALYVLCSCLFVCLCGHLCAHTCRTCGQTKQ